MDNKKFLPFLVIIVVGIFIIVSLSSSLFYTLGPAERGVVFYKFGIGLDKETAIKSETEAVLGSKNNNVQMKALLIRSINLPAQIKQAIENKLQQEQEALAYQFRLDKEKSEAERKRIAAEGEAAANKIINNSLTPELLKMRGIEATIELSKSPNSKVVVIGSGKDGLPLILGNN
mgnify:CR=1 FL=1